MKKSNKLLTGFTVIAALIVGFLVGISVEYPRINTSKLSGTIGKVNNYRNTKVTEEDIQLKNEIVEDSILMKSLTNYFTFNYAKSIDLANNINLAVEKASEDKGFTAEYESGINSLKKYADFLDKTRTNLLLGVTTIQNANEINPIDLRTIIARAQNVVIQANYKNQSILDFIDSADEFIMENGTKEHKGVTEAHDLLMLKQINHSVLNKDKMVLKFLNNKKIYNNIGKEQLSFSINDAVQNDMESLKWNLDEEKLGFFDSEKLGMYLNEEKLNVFGFDAEVLSWCDSEKLGMLHDNEKLGTAGGTFDTEKLGSIGSFDAEKLGIRMDAEKLGIWDAEKLGWHDNEKLKSCLDSEILGLTVGGV